MRLGTTLKSQRKITCHYKTLGISVRASQEEIRSAFRYLAMKLHPDRNPGNPVAAERFREVRKAYETLKDPAARGKYDRIRGYRKSRENYSDSSWTDIHSEGGEASSFDEIFQDLFGIGKRQVRTTPWLRPQVRLAGFEELSSKRGLSRRNQIM